MTTCPVLEELGLGRCMNEATKRVHDFADRGAASILSCAEHVPIARAWVQNITGAWANETTWPDRTRVIATKPVIA